MEADRKQEGHHLKKDVNYIEMHCVLRAKACFDVITLRCAKNQG